MSPKGKNFLFDKPIWNFKAPPKDKYFVWIVVLNRVNTYGDMVQKCRPLIAPNLCIMCCSSSKSVSHLFSWHFLAVNYIWNKVFDIFGESWVCPKLLHGCISFCILNSEALRIINNLKLWQCYLSHFVVFRKWSF